MEAKILDPIEKYSIYYIMNIILYYVLLKLLCKKAKSISPHKKISYNI